MEGNIMNALDNAHNFLIFGQAGIVEENTETSTQIIFNYNTKADVNQC